MNGRAGKRAACLLIHGFGGSPFEMEPLAPDLEARGCTVEIPALPGHKGDIGRFRTTHFPDWLAHAERRFFWLWPKRTTPCFPSVFPWGRASH